MASAKKASGKSTAKAKPTPAKSKAGKSKAAAGKSKPAAGKSKAAAGKSKATAPKRTSKQAKVPPVVLGATGLRQDSFISTIAISADGSRIATGDGDGRVRVFDIASNAMVFEAKWIAKDHRGRHGIQRLAFSPDGSVITGFTGIIGHGNLCAAHLASGVTWFETADKYDSYAMAPDGSQFVCAKTWNLDIVNARDGTCTTEVKLPEGCLPVEVAWSPDGAWIVASFYDQETEKKTYFAVIDGRTLEFRSRHDVGQDLTGARLAFGRDGKLFAIVEPYEKPPKPRIVEFDPASGEFEVRPIEGDLGSESLQCDLLASRGEAVLRDWRGDRSLVVDLAQARVERTLPSDTRVAAASADGAVVATAHGVAMRVWNRAWDELSSKPGLSTTVHTIAFIDGDQHVLTCDDTGVRTWSLDGAMLSVLELDNVTDYAPVANAIVVARGGRTSALAFPSCKPLGSGVDDELSNSPPSPDARYLASRNYETARGRILLWSLETGKLLHTLDVDPGESVYGIAFSADNTKVAGGSWAGRIRVFAVASGELLTSAGELRAWGQTALSFSNDGSMLASGDHGKTVRLWNLPSGKLRHKLVGHARKYIRATAFSPNDTLLASMDEASIRLWNPRDGKQVGVARIEGKSMAFSSDGTKLAVGGGGEAWILDVASLIGSK